MKACGTRKREAGICIVRVLIALLFPAMISGGSKSDILNSSHNLSVSGHGSVTSQQSEVCIFCHTPHSSSVDIKPLWNHQLTVQSYSLYTSSTLKATLQQPGQVSKQCLSCHDGTVALGQTIANGLISTQGAMGPKANFGTDLRKDHPIAFNLVDDGQLVSSLFQSPPSTNDPAVKLVNSRVECVTCHDPHTQNLDPVSNKFLVRSNASSFLCLACHDPARSQPNPLNGWNTGSHRNSTNATPNNSSFGAYGTVGLNGCLNCHVPHGAPINSSPRLLRNYEEAACTACHSGANLSPSLQNVLGEFSKSYTHPTTTQAAFHDANENAFPLNTNRHAECVDCHNSHAASSTGGTSTPPNIESPLLGVSGVDASTGAIPRRPASNEYEVCFKCHANSTNKPQAPAGYAIYGRTPRRVTDNTSADPYNTRLEFSSIVSHHPVTQPRSKTSTEAPSLRSLMINLNGSTGRSLAIGTYVYCTDCHTNNAARSSAGTGPNGPHGSTWPHLLERRYEVEIPPSSPGGSAGGVSYVSGIAGTAGLCYKCHDIDNNILQNRSFKEHQKHVQGENSSCSTCHDAHGIQGGNTTNNFSLVNFDLAVVGANSSGILRFEHTGMFSGRCYLRCHGQDHNPESY